MLKLKMIIIPLLLENNENKSKKKTIAVLTMSTVATLNYAVVKCEKKIIELRNNIGCKICI